MKGKRVVLTGASRGIGRETARALGKLGADLTFVVRDRERGEAVASEVRALGGGGDVEVLIADLSSMADVRRVAEEILAKHAAIDVLLNNAGGIWMDHEKTVDGFERTFATNHLSYFLLTQQLLPAIKKAVAGRIVNVASEAHRAAKLDFDDLMFETRKYSGWGAYTSSKLANILFTNELARTLEGTSVTTNSLHPGAVASGFAANNKGAFAFLWKLGSVFMLSSEKGAKTSVFLASDPSVANVTGKYFDKCHARTPSREAGDPSAAKRLWKATESILART